MKILLDECIDRKLAREFVEHDVKTVPQMGWAGIKNGELLSLAEAELMFLSQSIEICRFNKIYLSSILP